MTIKLLNNYELRFSHYDCLDANYIVVVWGFDKDVHKFADRTNLNYIGRHDNSCAGAYEIIFKFDKYEDAIGLMDFAMRYENYSRVNMEFYEALDAVEEEE